MTVKECMANNFNGPGTIILKVNFLCINGFSPVNARLLIVYGTSFYAIIHISDVLTFKTVRIPDVPTIRTFKVNCNVNI